MSGKALVAVMSLPCVLVATWLGSPAPAAACSCAAQAEEDGTLRGAEVVFRGTVAGDYETLLVDQGAGYGEMYRFRFRVERYFKGRLGSELDVLTEDWRAGCGQYFESGAAYLVYADYMDDGSLGVSGCSQTLPIASAARALSVLGEGTPPEGVSQDVVLDGASDEDEGCSVVAPGARRGSAASALSAALLLGLVARRPRLRRSR